jgi:SPP1 gp7 family putative phage head morphogenesis protein
LICSSVDNSFKNELTDVKKVLTEREINSLIEGIFLGEINPFDLPENVYLATGSILTDAIYKGMNITADSIQYLGADESKFFHALRDNAYKFSGAKTFDQVLKMSDALIDASGNVVPFKDFKKIAGDIFETYNKNYLKTEYQHALSTSQMAENWVKLEKNKETFPLLEYATTGDGRVRDEHAILDGIIKKVDDSFWKTYYPPNGWGCRCDVFQLAELDDVIETATDKNDLPKLDPEFEINFGEKKVLFSPKHPYFIVDDQFSELKKDNFNLPIPPL